jgi:hypothetical protein
MNTGKISKMALSAIALAGILAAGPVNANTIYTLTTGNSGISSYGSPYGTVTVSLNSGTEALITFTAASSGAYHYLFGDGGSVAVNVNGAATLGAVGSYTQPQTEGGAPQSPSYTTSSGNEDGMGSYSFSLDNVDGYQHAVSVLTFTLEKTTGIWLNDASVLMANANNAFVAAHIFVVHADAMWSNTGATGYASGSTSDGQDILVPDGGLTVALLGIAVAGVGMARRKFGV